MPHHARPLRRIRKLTRRDMLRLGGTAAAGAAVLGCGGGDDRRTVTVFSPMGEVKNQALARQVDRFMALRDDLRVEVMPVPWDQGHAKLLTMIAGGNPPDVITATGQWMAEFRAMGAIEDLTSWHASWPHRDAFTRTALLRCESSTAIEEGRVYGLPLELTTRAMFYRGGGWTSRDWNPRRRGPAGALCWSGSPTGTGAVTATPCAGPAGASGPGGPSWRSSPARTNGSTGTSTASSTARNTWKD